MRWPYKQSPAGTIPESFGGLGCHGDARQTLCAIRVGGHACPKRNELLRISNLNIAPRREHWSRNGARQPSSAAASLGHPHAPSRLVIVLVRLGCFGPKLSFDQNVLVVLEPSLKTRKTPKLQNLPGRSFGSFVSDTQNFQNSHTPKLASPRQPPSPRRPAHAHQPPPASQLTHASPIRPSESEPPAS